MTGCNKKRNCGISQTKLCMSENNLVTTEEFERRKVNQLTQKYEYGSITYDQMLQSLICMGWDKNDMEKILKEHYDLK